MTKLWNAARLVVDRGGRGGEPAPRRRDPGGSLDRLPRDGGRGAGAARSPPASSSPQLADLVYHLIFDDYCDWYLELLKAGEATPDMAGHALEQILALAHPLMPFVTEECWSRLPGARGAHGDARAAGRAGPRATRRPRPRWPGCRRSSPPCAPTAPSRGLPPRAPLVMEPPPHPAIARPRRGRRRAGRARGAAHHGRSLADGRSIAVGPAEERIDPAAERTRLAGELAKAADRAAPARRRKLANARFVERAPAPPRGGRARQGRALRHRARRARRPPRRARRLSRP